jgi:hypothetical protein
MSVTRSRHYFFFGSAGNRTRASGSVAKNSDHGHRTLQFCYFKWSYFFYLDKRTNDSKLSSGKNIALIQSAPDFSMNEILTYYRRPQNVDVVLYMCTLDRPPPPH